MIVLAAVLATVIACYLHTRLLANERAWSEARLRDQEIRHADHITRLLGEKNPDLEQVIGLVDRLCQRVQAPAQAVYEHAMAEVPESPPAVPFDDDEAFHAAREGVSKEALADMLMEAEVAGVAS